MVDPRPHKPSFVSSILTSTTLRPASVMDAHKSSKLVDQVRFLGGLLMWYFIFRRPSTNSWVHNSCWAFPNPDPGWQVVIRTQEQPAYWPYYSYQYR